MKPEIRDAIGRRGELLFEYHLLDYESFDGPLFCPGYLDGKWPTIDFYVELVSVAGARPFFLAQVKATSAALASDAIELPIKAMKEDVERLSEMPGPTYLFGIHEPSKRVFACAITKLTPHKTISSIPLTHELTEKNLVKLHDEVRAFWASSGYKPEKSVFA